MDEENLSYSELVVIALENLLERTQEAKKLSTSLEKLLGNFFHKEII